MKDSKLKNVTKEELEKLILIQNLSYEEVGELYGVTGNSIKKKARKLGIDLSLKKRPIPRKEKIIKGKLSPIGIISKLDTISDSEFEKIVKSSISLKEVSDKIGYKSPKIRKVKEKIDQLNLDISHFKRIPANNGKKQVSKSKMSTKQLGNIGEAKTLSKFVELRIPVFIPFGDNEKSDLVAEFNGKLNKIQVKTSEFSKNNKISFNLSSHTKSGIHTYNKLEVDYFSLYNLQEDILILVPISVLEGRSYVSFRINKNSEKSINQFEILNWEDFLFEKILKS